MKFIRDRMKELCDAEDWPTWKLFLAVGIGIVAIGLLYWLFTFACVVTGHGPETCGI